MQKLIASCLSGVHPVSKPCIVSCRFVQASSRRDTDNVGSAVKFILDALVKNEVLKNDSPKYVVGTPLWVEYGDENKVIVTLIELDSRQYGYELLAKSRELIECSCTETEQNN